MHELPLSPAVFSATPFALFVFCFLSPELRGSSENFGDSPKELVHLDSIWDDYLTFVSGKVDSSCLRLRDVYYEDTRS